MASSTRYYGLGFFDFSDPLGTDFSGQVEIDRFVFLDKQIFGLMSIFGNGVIQGWQVTAEGTFSVSINEGYGNVNFIAARTTFPVTIFNIPPNSVNYIFAKVKDRTTMAEEIDFHLSPTRNLNDPHFLLLAEVTTGPSSITNIDNSIRQEIAFIELIKAAIQLHKHRGGSLHPSKIDLQSEVKGQLPSFRISDFDANKITTGTFDLSRIPMLDHQELSNVGLLTHPQLDSFVKTIETSNREIFGEIGTSNLLQLILAMKLIYDDPDSAFYINDKTVDKNMVNQIALIPGITPNSFIDFEHTTAEINLEDHYIEGTQPQNGTSFFVHFRNELAWNSAHFMENVIVSGDTVIMAFNDDIESNIVTIEGFESASIPGQSLAGGTGGQDIFKKETVIISDNADIKARSSATNVLEGFYSGEFTHRQSFRNRFVKEFNQPQDWSLFDSLVVNVKCLSSIHGPVKMYLESVTGEKSTDFVILEQDQITSNPDLTKNNFEKRVVDLFLIPFRNQVKKIVFFTDDLQNPFSFFIDHINIQRAILLPEHGQIRLRFSSNAKVVFSNIQWSTIEPPGTDVQIRVRSAIGTAFLTRSDYTPFLSNGELINLEGTDIEIEVNLFSDPDRISSPVLQSIRLLLLTDSDFDGFTIDSVDEFSLGSSENILINASPVSLSLNTPVYVDSYYFGLGNVVSQISEGNLNGNPFTQGELAIFGNNTPIAPNQIFQSIENEENRVTLPRLSGPRSVVRQNKRTFVIADTYNDRVLEIDENRNLISGLGSINYTHNTLTFPISACVDVRTGILYIVWSRPISFSSINVSQIVIQSNNQQIQLIRDVDKINGMTTLQLESSLPDGQIMPIHLSVQNASLAKQLPSNESFLFVSAEASTSGLDFDSVFYNAISTALGIPCFIGNFAYINGIFSPTWAEKTTEDGFVITNATVAVKDYKMPSGIDETIVKNSNVSSIIEIDKNNNIIFGSNILNFSPFIPGRATKINKNTILAGGLRPSGVPGVPSANAPFDFRSISGTPEERLRKKQTLESIFFGGTSPFVGAVVIFDTRTRSSTFEYISSEGILVSDVDIDSQSGNFVVAESSFKNSGRIIKLDAAGNIVFSWGEGLHSIINDISVQIDGSVVIST